MLKFQTIGKRAVKTDHVEVKHAQYLNGYKISIDFSDGKKSIVDFEPFLSSKKGYLTKYQRPASFKRFKIENGNLVWGKDWDLIFPIDDLYKGRI